MKKNKVIPTSQYLQWILAAILVVLLLLMLNHFHITPEMILNYQPASLFAAAAILIVLHAVKIMIPLLSIAVLQIAAGHLFPTWIAFLVNSAGILMSVTVPYWIGRRAGMKAVGRLTDKYPHFQVLLERQQENAWFFCFFIRIIGLLPANLVTMYIGATHTPFLPNLLAGSLGFMPGMILATLVGSSIRDPSSPVFWISIALSALLSVVSAVGYHIYQNRKQKQPERSFIMSNFVKLNLSNLPILRRMDERLVSYNIEMTEVTGGTFWKSYTDAQVEGTEEFPPITDWHDMGNLQQWFDPIDLCNPRLRKMAKALGTAWVRVSGTWANKTYYDFDGHTGGVVPDGYQNLLTEAQWKGVLDFVKAIDGKLLVSVANCPGIHSADEPWHPEQARLLFDYSKNYGVPVAAAEFTNEPNMPTMSGQPEGYTSQDFNRDHNLFVKFMKENYPEILIVGPCTVGDFNLFAADESQSKGDAFGGGLAAGFETWTTEALMDGFTEKMDVFSYHYYNGVSERGAAMGGHWPADKVLSESYLSVAGNCARFYAPKRDIYVPGGQMWVTESGDAGGGGNTWASTYMDVPRTLNELGEFCTITDGVIFHNTLASSDYGFLQHGSFQPRPNFFAVLLWKQLMGNVVYDAGLKTAEGVHVYAHNRKDGRAGMVYLVINNSTTDDTAVELPKDAERYTLSGDGRLRSRTMCLNGVPLVLNSNDEVPEMLPVSQTAGTVELAPATCTFFVLPE